MGNCVLPIQSEDSCEKISIRHFKLQKIIGRGGSGIVWKAQNREDKKFYAVKEMSKSVIIQRRSVSNVWNERKVLSLIKSPFVVNLQYAFQDSARLYLVTELLEGGDLRRYMRKYNTFNEAQARFIVACIISGLECLHLYNIVHRDIKPENILMDSNGYLKIADCGFAKLETNVQQDYAYGTPAYIAPEILRYHSYDTTSDYFSLGVMLYEIMMGHRPYSSITRCDMLHEILSGEIVLRRQDIPQGWSGESADFINKLLQINPKLRLGSRGINEIRKHAWLVNFPWDDLMKGTMRAPYEPDIEHARECQNSLNVKIQRVDKVWLGEKQLLFHKYYYDHSDLKSCKVQS